MALVASTAGHQLNPFYLQGSELKAFPRYLAWEMKVGLVVEKHQRVV